MRRTQRHRLGEVAQWVECSFTADDLVLPPSLREAIDDLVFEARARAQVWEDSAARRLFPQGRGLLALLAGPPGTGKTMTAQTVAASLGLDLFRISLSEVVSKYVGETSKNLQRVFARAEEMDAVLLFDEADALFSRRTEIKDAHDRYANTDTNHLLQAVEAYGGVALLATNRKVEHRRRFPASHPLRARHSQAGPGEGSSCGGASSASWRAARRATRLASPLHGSAGAVEATGAQIKYAVLSALFAAKRDGAPVGMTHILRGLEREADQGGPRAHRARARPAVCAMIPKTVRIDELLLRLPSLDEAQARRLAEDVADRLARALGRTEMYPIPAGASLSIRIPDGTPPEELARDDRPPDPGGVAMKAVATPQQKRATGKTAHRRAGPAPQHKAAMGRPYGLNHVAIGPAETGLEVAGEPAPPTGRCAASAISRTR